MSQIVLVIDDEQSVRDAFELALEDTGYQLLYAENGEKGVKEALNNKPDLIFLDLKMPGKDGIETLRDLRSQGVQVPVYMITAFVPEFLGKLAELSNEKIEFGLGQKPLSGAQIKLIVKGTLDKPTSFEPGTVS